MAKKKQSEHVMRRHFVISVMTDKEGREITEKTSETVEHMIRHKMEVDREVSYAIWVLETAPDTGRLHFHVYVEYANSVRLRTIRKEWTEDIGWGSQEVRAGTRMQARTYCTAEHFDKKKKAYKSEYTHLAGPWEHGSWRGDADDSVGISREQQAYLVIAEGGHPREVALLDPQMYGRHFRGLYALYNELRGLTPKGVGR